MKENTKNKDITYTTDELAQAVKIVNAAIRAREAEFRRIASDGEEQVVTPNIVAQVFLDYNYATISILGEEVPHEMWRELVSIFGLDDVFSVDL